MATKILQIDLQNDITPQIGSYDNAGGVTPNNWSDEGGVYSLGPTNRDGTIPYYWFTPTREVTDFDLCWEDYQYYDQTTPQYHLEIGDSTGNVVLSAFRQHANYYIGPVNIFSPAYQTWHKILVEIRKASASSSTVTVYLNGKKIATGTSSTLLTSAKIALLGHVPDVFYYQNAGQRLRYVTIYDRSYASKGINLDGMMTTITALISKLIAKLSTVALTGSYNDLSDKPTISTVNDAALTIQQNGVNVQTFTANQSTNATANIQCVDLTNNQTVAGNKEFTGTTTAHDLVPSATDTYNFGSSSYQWNNAYIKSLTINGVAAGDILTHNASEFVDISSNQTIGGVKTFSSSPRVTKAFPDIALNISDCDVTELPTEAKIASLFFRDKNNKNLAYFSAQQRTNGEKRLCLRTHRTDNINNYYSVDLDSDGDFYPEQNNAINLGTSTSKWKSFNGINPGALSLPGTSVNIDTTNWVLDGSNVNIFTPTSDGWLGIQVTDTVYDQMHYVFVGRNDSASYYQQNVLSPINALWDSEYHGCVFIPVVKNFNYDIRCICSTIVATFYPCQGNV